MRADGLAPTATSPNASEAAAGTQASTGEAATPLPLRLTTCGEPAAFETTLMLPLTAPATLGVKLLVRVQALPAARMAPQLCDTAKPLLAAMPEISSAPEPLLFSVTLRPVEVTPTVWLPNASEAGARFTAGVASAAPVPAKLSSAAPLLAFEARVSVALRAPTALGLKLIVIVQLAAAARLPVAVQVPP